MAEHAIPPGFLERARREAERYGDDPWIMLRELVQNSRDAGARHIDFTATTRDGQDELVCTDDGSGMTRADIRSYLLRLYASGKAPARGESEQDRARGPVGRFGVGFWSVLRFQPSIVRVESRAGDQGTAFEVDCTGRVLREVPCALSRRGTRVTLLRPSAPAGDVSFVDEAKQRLSRWAGYVRGLYQDPPPRLTFNGARRNVVFAPPDLIGEHIAGKGFDGVVGLGTRPSVKLYAHGLLLREAASLEELLPKRHSRLDLDTPGLYPVVRVNADGLEVLMNRRAVVEDHLLEDIVTTCERRLARQRRRLLNRLAPMRLIDRLRVSGPRLWPVAAAIALSLGAGGVSYGLLEDDAASFTVVSSSAPGSSARSPGANLDLASGPRINQPSLTLQGSEVWDISFEAAPGSFHLVTLTSLSRYDVAAGLVADAPAIAGQPSPGQRSDESVLVTMGLGSSAGVVALPVPSGHGVVPASVRVDGARATAVGGVQGEPLVRLDGGERRVRYTTGPTRGAPPSAAQLLAPERWPSSAESVLKLVAPLPLEQRVRTLEGFVKARVRYTTSLSDTARFDRARGPFVNRALEVGAGDCDVMNALFALLLRAAGIPARVNVGLVVDDGVVAPDLHAWTEYWIEGGWHTLDVSPPLPVASDAFATVDDTGPAHSASDDALPSAAPGENPRVPVGRATAALLETSSGTRAESAHGTSSSALRRWLADVRRTGRAPLLGAVLVASGMLLLLLALSQLRLRRRQEGDDEALARLLWHWLQGPRGADPMHLRLRPFFPTLTGNRRLSLSDLERQAARGELLAAEPNDPLLRYLRPAAVVVDASQPGVEHLLSLLPERVSLAELRPIVRGDAPALLREVEAALREVDDGVRLHVMKGAMGLREVELPVRDGGLPPRHVLVGADDPHWRRLIDDDSERPALRRFRAARFLLEQTTLYRAQRDGILARLAREALT